MTKPILTEKQKDRLYSQLIKLGDMMGDGMHYEPDGKWIEKEYKQTMKALGIGPQRKDNKQAINKFMVERVNEAQCLQCKGKLKQTRSGSTIGKCVDCGARFRLMKIKSKRG
ncbi:MAG: hypothetical protein WC143_08345 [Eubacteriales bacterium]